MYEEASGHVGVMNGRACNIVTTAAIVRRMVASGGDEQTQVLHFHVSTSDGALCI